MHDVILKFALNLVQSASSFCHRYHLAANLEDILLLALFIFISLNVPLNWSRENINLLL